MTAAQDRDETIAAAEIATKPKVDVNETLAGLRATIEKMDALKQRMGDAVDLSAIRLAREMGASVSMLEAKYGQEKLTALGDRNRARQASEAPASLSREWALPSLDLEGVAAHLATSAHNVVVLCGAGISVSAGIPDFRSPGTGLYDNLQKYDLPTPQSIFTLDYFEEKPDAFYQLAAELWPGRFQPTPTHSFLRLLHEKGVLRRVFTQNIDGLERLAGLPADKVVAAHGSFDSATCLETGAAVPPEELRAAVAAGKDGPKGWEALAEKHGGLVKPDIVFFGEQLPRYFHEAVEDDLPEADLLLVLGTSLAVQPFASLVGKVHSDTPRVLLNAERVGCADPFLAMLGVEQPPELLAVDSATNYRDVLHLGGCDASVRELSSLAGWRADLERVDKLVADAHGKGQRVAPPPPQPSAPPPRRISLRLPTLDLAGVAKFMASDECRSVVLLMGAGVSCGAGIPDFRSAGGMYETLRPELITATAEQRRMMEADPSVVVQREMFLETPLPYMEVRRPFILGTRERRWRATLSHRFAEVLHAKGKLTRLFTQNIDGLDHQCTSIPEEKIVPVHGSIGRVACEHCGREADYDAFCDAVSSKIKDIYQSDSAAPEWSSPIACEHCGRCAVKPTTVLFGSPLPRTFFELSKQDLPAVDLLIIAGTSLQVAPANGVPGQVADTCVRLVVNREPVGANLPEKPIRYGDRATRDVFAEGECDDVFAELARLLGWLPELQRFEAELPEKSLDALRAVRSKRVAGMDKSNGNELPQNPPDAAAPASAALLGVSALTGSSKPSRGKNKTPAASGAGKRTSRQSRKVSFSDTT